MKLLVFIRVRKYFDHWLLVRPELFYDKGTQIMTDEIQNTRRYYSETIKHQREKNLVLGDQ
jgi:hypothetical protein